MVDDRIVSWLADRDVVLPSRSRALAYGREIARRDPARTTDAGYEVEAVQDGDGWRPVLARPAGMCRPELYDIETGRIVRAATADEVTAGRGRGPIQIDGRSCYVIEA